MNARVHIGTSGWSYPHWHGPFYPPQTDRSAELEYYAAQFSTVEINNSFYGLPEIDTLKSWYRSTPGRFVFTVKMSRYVTHMKKLNDPAEPVGNFLRRIDTLEDKLGPVLLQLPPRWHFNEPRLRDFLDGLDTRYRYAFEFRDRSWFDDRSLNLLETHGAALCIYDLAGWTSPKTVTADFVYVRLHGPHAAYEGSYDQRTLAGWAGAFSTWRAQGREIFCYFDNDARGHAAANARSLLEMLS